MKVALCLSGIVGGFSGRNGSGLQIPVQLCRDEWHRALFNNYDTDVLLPVTFYTLLGFRKSKSNY